MAAKIDTVNARRALTVRAEPHWHKLRRGGYVGYRKMKDGGTWICRWRDETGKQNYKSLGELKNFPPEAQFDEASKQASAWFSLHERTPRSRTTVTDAAEEYLRHIKITKSVENEKRYRWQIERHITPVLGNKLLEDLRHHHVNNWLYGMVTESDDREEVRRSKDSANRMLGLLKALLNFAKKNKRITTDEAWKDVERFQKVATNRKVFLTDEQITRLLDNTTGDFHDLIRGLLLTGMRPGKEPENLLVEQFDPQHKTIDILMSKTGPRTVYLSDDAVQFFRKLTKDKLPKAQIFNVAKKPQAGRLMREAVKAAKLPRDTVLYSLRHTYISKAIMAGLPLQIIAENTGTSIKMIENHYGKFTSQFRHEMLNKVKMI